MMNAHDDQKSALSPAVSYFSTKTYDYTLGLSTVFRQWRATSHCRVLHGYALNFRFLFGASHLDDRNWVVDFGGLRQLKAWLVDHFDHTTCVAQDDPALASFRDLHHRGLIDLREVSHTGCEGFAEMAFRYADSMIGQESHGRCWVQEVEVREHGGNSAIVRR